MENFGSSICTITNPEKMWIVSFLHIFHIPSFKFLGVTSHQYIGSQRSKHLPTEMAVSSNYRRTWIDMSCVPVPCQELLS